MTLSSAIRRVLVCAFAAWMALCCCEKRLLAEQFSGRDTAPAASACCCCGGDRGSGAGDCDDARDGAAGQNEVGQDEGTPAQHDRDDSDHPRNCSDGCCQKAAPQVECFTPDTDLIGAPLLAALQVDGHATPCHAPTARVGESPGEPPPWIALVISARLRI